MKKKLQNKRNKSPKFNWFYIVLGVVFALVIWDNKNSLGSSSSSSIQTTEAGNTTPKEKATDSKFFTDLAEGKISNVSFEKNTAIVSVFLKNGKTNKNSLNPLSLLNSNSADYKFTAGSPELFEQRFNAIKAEKNLDTTIEFKIASDWSGLISLFLPILMLGLLWYFMFRKSGAGGGSQIFSVGKSRAKLFDGEDKVKTRFSDVAGLEGAKEEVMELVDFLKNPEKYTKLGGKIPKGILMEGPPGTGKTLLAKAVAGEAGVPFFSISGSDFSEMFVGVGAARVRDLFKQAKEKSPSIIFIDEIDAIGRARGKNNMTGANDERENTLNQLLTEMDGFETDMNVIIMAATNRADVLDKALRRPGRFDRTVRVDLPGLKEREQIFNVHLKKLILAKDIDVEFLAKQTPGFSGADIANICNEAALVAARKSKNEVQKEDFLEAVDRVVGGIEKRSMIITPSERKRVAYHEAGHATVSWFTEHASPLVKVTIVPRGQSLGAAWYLPEERKLTTTDQMQDDLCSLLGGRASEEVFFGNISTGALSDLERTTKQANAMVTIYGLSPKVGNVSYYDPQGEGFTKPYSEKTAELIDSEISDIVETQYKRAKEIITQNKEKLTKLAERLLETEVLFKDDLIEIFGTRPFDKEEDNNEVTPISDNTEINGTIEDVNPNLA